MEHSRNLLNIVEACILGSQTGFAVRGIDIGVKFIQWIGY